MYFLAGIGLGFLGQFFLDHSAAKRSASAQLRQERQKVHIRFHTEVNKFYRDISEVLNKGVDENEKQHREFFYNSRPVLDLLPSVELIAGPSTYLAARNVADVCMEYESHSAAGIGMRLNSEMKKYLAAVRKELGLPEPKPAGGHTVS